MYKLFVGKACTYRSNIRKFEYFVIENIGMLIYLFDAIPRNFKVSEVFWSDFNEMMNHHFRIRTQQI